MSRSSAGKDSVIYLTESPVQALITERRYINKDVMGTPELAEFLELLFSTLANHPDPTSLDSSSALNIFQDVLRERVLEAANSLKEDLI